MHKKLIKYGNSNALVLDRSILALLNISEGSIVKLRIEGDTLLITAAKEAKPTDLLQLEVENIHERLRSKGVTDSSIMDLAEEQMRQYCKKAQKDPSKMKELKKWLPGTENAKKLQEAYQKIMVKYQDEMMVLASKEFKEATNALSKKNSEK